MRGAEMIEQNKKCPNSNQGLMKMVLATEPLTETPKPRPMQARCDTCGFQDDFTKFYPLSKDSK